MTLQVCYMLTCHSNLYLGIRGWNAYPMGIKLQLDWKAPLAVVMILTYYLPLVCVPCEPYASAWPRTPQHPGKQKLPCSNRTKHPPLWQKKSCWKYSRYVESTEKSHKTCEKPTFFWQKKSCDNWNFKKNDIHVNSIVHLLEFEIGRIRRTYERCKLEQKSQKNVTFRIFKRMKPLIFWSNCLNLKFPAFRKMMEIPNKGQKKVRIQMTINVCMYRLLDWG